MVTDDKRLDDIFRYIVEMYVETAVPVGSKAVSEMYEGRLSPATIRNVMVVLEDMGLIHQPHTSAGRIPTEKGYRYYVDYLMRRNYEDEINIPDFIAVLQDMHHVETIAEKVSRILSELTNNAGVVLMKNVRGTSYLSRERGDSGGSIEARQDFERYDIFDRIYIDGASFICEQPEFKDADSIFSLLKTFEVKEGLASFFEKRLLDRKLRIDIGSEVDFPDLRNVSVISKEYFLDDEPVGCLGVIGPTRMKYDKTSAIVDHMADSFTEFLKHI
jgi:transcriptional regulator of heat shock response